MLVKYKIDLKPLVLINKLFFASKKTGTSSNIWLERQRKDPYVKRAVKETYRARSAFKLIEINDKYKFIKPGDTVIDIGACPGSWSQVAIQLTNSDNKDSSKPKGKVISVDREFINPIEGADVLSYADITEKQTQIKIENLLNGKKANSVISDMAPNSTGQSTFDHDAIIELQEKALEIAKEFLELKGHFVCKIWFGDRTNDLTKKLLKNFEFVKLIKPPASRNDSAEIFIFCSNFKS
ncbi:unnamed protein product [Brachionus calyciflorus]|uniref:rRNA methyltransferase 2, mitochondrial n=1 Tax=Brachionus calyciflorus TaxID=104777 RepID=A0A814R307_9BILA|nr:unnamed protein product [Brachionus calyciflorus]